MFFLSFLFTTMKPGDPSETSKTKTTSTVSSSSSSTKTTMSSDCLYHSRAGRGLLEHVCNLLTKLKLFTQVHRSLLRRATCTCAPTTPQSSTLLPLSPDSGLPELSAKLGATESTKSLVAIISPKTGKDSPQLTESKLRLMAVVLRFLQADQSSIEATGGPFGFTPEFMEEVKAKSKAAQSRLVTSSAVLPLKSEAMAGFIGPQGSGLKDLGIPEFVKVCIEDDKSRRNEANKTGKEYLNTGVVIAHVRAKVETPQERKKREKLMKVSRSRSRSRDKDAMDVDQSSDSSSSSSSDDEDVFAPVRTGRVHITWDQDGKETTKDDKEEPRKTFEEERKELQAATDAVLQLLVARAAVFSLPKIEGTSSKRKRGTGNNGGVRPKRRK